jgi:hypothetical protein
MFTFNKYHFFGVSHKFSAFYSNMLTFFLPLNSQYLRYFFKELVHNKSNINILIL